MNTLLRERLDMIDAWLSEQSQEAQGLWDVLSAIRGPDNSHNEDLKKATTAVIRAQAFPLAMARGHLPAASNFKASSIIIPPDLKANWSDHFRLHIAYAAHALEVPVE